MKRRPLGSSSEALAKEATVRPMPRAMHRRPPTISRIRVVLVTLVPNDLLRLLALPLRSDSSRTSPQKRHFTAETKIISPHIGQGRFGSGADVMAGSGSASL